VASNSPGAGAVDGTALTAGASAGLFKGLPGQPTPSGTHQPVHVLTAGFMWPVAVIRGNSLRNNAAVMTEVCVRHGVEHAPHLKTAMSPELARVQATAGAWGFTVGSASQLRTARAWGSSRLILAAESVDTEFLTWVRSELDRDPAFELYLFVDSVAGANVAARHLAGAGLQAGMLIEVGHLGGRTGVRDAEAARTLAHAINALGLSLAGVAGYEGTIGADRTPSVCGAISAYLGELRSITAYLDGAGMFDPLRETLIVSCGGSTFFDLVANELSTDWALTRPVTTVLRGGCYLLHDHEFYAAGAPTFAWGGRLEPALEVWAQVISRPEPGLAILNAGRRDIGFDLGLPLPLRIIDPASKSQRPAGGTITELNDQHAYLKVPGNVQVSIGDVVALGLSHPCTTMDKWRAVPVLDAQDHVIDYVRTYF
jgi:D-serine deaminase-like pyridoxal phosphate-dependent protein